VKRLREVKVRGLFDSRDGIFYRQWGKKPVLILKNRVNNYEKNSYLRKTKHKSINSNNPSTKSFISNHEPGKNIDC
jgi:hypothetical protein